MTENKTCFCGISEYCGYQIETDMEQHDKVIFEDGYNKAIDDLVTKCKQNTNDMFGQKYVDVRVLDTLAEQLKGEKQ